MVFDPGDKKNLPIINYLSDKVVLIVDPTRNVTTLTKKLFCDFGCKVQNVYVVDNLHDFESFFNEKKPNFVFTTSLIEKKQSVDYIAEHIKMHPDRKNASFIIVSEDNSMATACAFLDEEIDALVTYPITIQGIQETILKVLNSKVNPGPLEIELFKGKEALFTGNNDDAEQIFSVAISRDQSSPLPLYFLGKLAEAANRIEDAIDYYGEALSKEPKHYKTLRALADIYFANKEYDDAYKTNAVILANYPLNVKRLPELIRLSISNNKFEDILNYADIFTKVEDENPEIKRYVSAGLATCGKFLLKNQRKDEGVTALKKAAEYSYQLPQIIDNICNTLFDSGLYKVSEEILAKAMEFDDNHPSYMTLNLKLLYSSDPEKCLLFGSGLLKKKIINQEIFLYMIKASIASKRNSQFTKDLIFEASKRYPEDKEMFENLQKDT